MSKRGDRELLLDIQEAIKRVLSYVQTTSYEGFLEDSKTQDAVIRNFEIIGEAVKNISPRIKLKYKGVAWSELAKLRDKLIHHYFGVNLDIVWRVMEESLPEIGTEIEEIINSVPPYN